VSITIVATVGAANANSFVTEAEYIARTATLPVVPTGTTVSGPTCSEAEKGWLLEAQRQLTLLSWKAGRVDSTQALAWPRLYAEDPDAPSLLGIVGATDFWFDQTEIPQRVKDAQVDLSLVFLAAGKNTLAVADETQGVIEETLDVMTTRWQPFQRAVGMAKYPRILALIAPLLNAGSGALTVVRV